MKKPKRGTPPLCAQAKWNTCLPSALSPGHGKGKPMLKETLLFIKYPYTAGVIATIWLGSAALLALNDGLPFIPIIIIDMLVSIFLAFFGFTGKKEL